MIFSQSMTRVWVNNDAIVGTKAKTSFFFFVLSIQKRRPGNSVLMSRLRNSVVIKFCYTDVGLYFAHYLLVLIKEL